MADQKKLELANKVYTKICKMLDSFDLKYDKNDEKLAVSLAARGEDLPVEFNFHVYPNIMVVSVLSQLPFKMAEEKRLEAAIALAALNDTLADGNFDFNLSTGTVVFRLSYCYIDCEFSDEIYNRLLELTMAVVDAYNDKLLMFSKGMLTLEQFLDDVKK